MPTPTTKATKSKDVSARELKHRQLAREAAAEGIVLLANDGSLPLAPCRVALYGAGAATTIKGGTGSGEVNERYSVTIEQGLAEAGFSVTTGDYLRDYEAFLASERTKHNKAMTRKFLSGDIINIMSQQFQYPDGKLLTVEDFARHSADLCIYVVARQAGECADRKLAKNDYDLTATEIANISLAAGHFAKTIVVINAGGQMDISPLDAIAVNAIVYFCQQGMEGGNGLADILTGAVTPSGALAATWPQKYGDWPGAMEFSYLKGHTDFDEYKEGIYVGYRYFDSFGVKPRYPFGFCMSYTDFSIAVNDVTAAGADISATVRVTNSGEKYAGKKTVQLYVSAPDGRLRREYQSLAAFAKTDVLAPGAAQDVTLTFALSDLAAYDEAAAAFILEKGDYIVRVGAHSADTEAVAVVSLDETVTTEVCMNICPPTLPIAEISAPPQAVSALAEGIKRISVSASAISTATHDYSLPEFVPGAKTAEVMAQVTNDDLCVAVSGIGMMNKGAAFVVPGAAGNTTSHLLHLGVPNSALCDGPAGVRIQSELVRYPDGTIKPLDVGMGLLDSLPWFMKKNMIGNPDKGELLYQYASAFPVGTAQAQTWNTDLVQRIGEAVGAEMEEFGVTYWLAPGMNIQRNPLCGRNFEYYSEDPLLTGRMAAAVTKGVQRHEGCYVTIKHYAANNLEDNRNRSDSRMNERVLREIYLKGFRIAVKEGGAKSVMTSYNKLNGVYTPNSYDLCTHVLRCEWGFGGVVMTDWFSTGKNLADNVEAIKAGNDLIMPGGKRYIKILKKAVADGSLPEAALRLSGARVLEAAINGQTGR